jgi:DNA (cytosine-5)-methyltransferase 1
LREAGYRVSSEPLILSPHMLKRRDGGRPQVRERVFIVAVRDESASATDSQDVSPLDLSSVLRSEEELEWDLFRDLPIASEHSDVTKLSEAEILWIDAWDDFVREMWKLRGARLPGFPLWADAWQLPDEVDIDSGTPKWKADFLRKNAGFYEQHQDFIDKWTTRWNVYGDSFPPSRRKLEWQAQDTKSLWDTVMHMRPSGIRAKRATYLPALVAITQTSILGPLRRRLSPEGAARLQGLPHWFSFDGQTAAATYKQLGNGVNIGVVWQVIRHAILENRDLIAQSSPGLVASLESSIENIDEILESMRK